MNIKNIKSKDVIKILEKSGFRVKRQSGTHVIQSKKLHSLDCSNVYYSFSLCLTKSTQTADFSPQ